MSAHTVSEQDCPWNSSVSTVDGHVNEIIGLKLSQLASQTFSNIPHKRQISRLWEHLGITHFPLPQQFHSSCSTCQSVGMAQGWPHGLGQASKTLSLGTLNRAALARKTDWNRKWGSVLRLLGAWFWRWPRKLERPEKLISLPSPAPSPVGKEREGGAQHDRQMRGTGTGIQKCKVVHLCCLLSFTSPSCVTAHVVTTPGDQKSATPGLATDNRHIRTLLEP